MISRVNPFDILIKPIGAPFSRPLILTFLEVTDQHILALRRREKPDLEWRNRLMKPCEFAFLPNLARGASAQQSLDCQCGQQPTCSRASHFSQGLQKTGRAKKYRKHILGRRINRASLENERFL